MTTDEVLAAWEQPLLTDARAVAAETGDTTLVSDSEALTKAIAAVPGLLKDDDPTTVRNLRNLWAETARRVVPLSREAGRREREYEARIVKIRNRMSEQGAGTGSLDASTRERDPAGTYLDLGNRLTLAMALKELQRIKEHSRPERRRLRRALRRIRLVRFMRERARVLLSTAFFLLLYLAILSAHGPAEKVAHEILHGSRFTSGLVIFVVLAAIMLVPELMKMWIEPRIERTLSRWERRDTRKEFLALVGLQVRLRIEIARLSYRNAAMQNVASAA